MNKLKLKDFVLNDTKVLDRAQMKNVMGGTMPVDAEQCGVKMCKADSDCGTGCKCKNDGGVFYWCS